MVLASPSVDVVEQTPNNGFCQCLCPQVKLQLPHASLRDSPRLAGRSDPGCFRITASALGPRAYEILCVPLRVEFLCPTALWVFQK